MNKKVKYFATALIVAALAALPETVSRVTAETTTNDYLYEQPEVQAPAVDPSALPETENYVTAGTTANDYLYEQPAVPATTTGQSALLETESYTTAGTATDTYLYEQPEVQAPAVDSSALPETENYGTAGTTANDYLYEQTAVPAATTGQSTLPPETGSCATVETITSAFLFEQPKLETGGEHYKVTMPGTVTFGNEGEPALPLKSVRLLLPPEGKVKKVTVLTGKKHILPGIYSVQPGGELLEGPGGEGASAPGPDPAIYGSYTPYPESNYTFLGVQKARGCRIGVVTLYPVEYVPAEGRVSWLSFMEVVIEIEYGGSRQEDPQYGLIRPLFRGLKEDRERVKRIIDNQHDFDRLYQRYWNADEIGQIPYDSPLLNCKDDGGTVPRPLPDPLPLPCDRGTCYVIITGREFVEYTGENSWHDLVHQKQGRGVSAHVFSTDWIYANYDGTRPDGGEDDQTRIRNFITDVYNVLHTEYVLLGGDSDGGADGEVIVPHRRLSAYENKGTPGWDRTLPGDIYYACLDGSYDFSFMDGHYGCPDDGEGGGCPDLLAEVYVGRAPVDSIEELRNFVRKTIAHENSTGAYLRSAALVGEELGGYRGEDRWRGGMTYGKHYLEEVRLGRRVPLDLAFPDTYDSAWGFSFCPYLDVRTLYDQESGSPEGWDRADVIDLVNGGVHLIAHAGHAYNNSLMKLTIGSAMGGPELLANTDYFFLQSGIGCYMAAFDNCGDGETGEYGAGDSIGEALVTGVHGAFGVVGNARAGGWTPDGTDTASHYMTMRFWDALFRENLAGPGEILQNSKEDNIWMTELTTGLYELYQVNLLGDPESPLKTKSERASLRFDSGTYAIGDRATICLSDLNIPPGTDSVEVTVQCKNPFVHTRVWLDARGDEPHTYLGTVALLRADSWLPDSAFGIMTSPPRIDVFHGSVIAVEYTDPDTGSGAGEVIWATAEVDDMAPAVTEVEVEERPTSCLITLRTDEPALVRASCRSLADGEVIEKGISYMGTEHLLLLKGLRPDTRYALTLETRDKVGNEGVHEVPGDLRTPGASSVLVVDDAGGPWSPSSYIAALEGSGIEFDLWDALETTPLGGSYTLPGVEDLSAYRVVLWDIGTGICFCTYKCEKATEYLAGGGRLMIAGSRVFDKMTDELRVDYLYVCDVDTEDSNDVAIGVPGDPITEGISLEMSWGGYPTFEPCADGLGILSTEDASFGFCGSRIDHPGTGHKAVVLSFPFSRISETAEEPDTRANLMRRIVDWLSE